MYEHNRWPTSKQAEADNLSHCLSQAFSNISAATGLDPYQHYLCKYCRMCFFGSLFPILTRNKKQKKQLAGWSCGSKNHQLANWANLIFLWVLVVDLFYQRVDSSSEFQLSLRILGMSWGVKTTCFEAPEVSLGGYGVSIGGGDGFLGLHHFMPRFSHSPWGLASRFNV